MDVPWLSGVFQALYWKLSTVFLNALFLGFIVNNITIIHNQHLIFEFLTLNHGVSQIMSSWQRLKYFNIYSFYLEYIHWNWQVCLIEDLDVFWVRQIHLRFMKSKIKCVLLTNIFRKVYLLILFVWYTNQQVISYELIFLRVAFIALVAIYDLRVTFCI